MSDIKVSVYCLAYNCVSFIEKSIKGMLNQKLDVGYKIIIHDDASNDGTTDIIRKYANQYPEKIVALIQSENQYSKGINIYDQYINPYIEGDYIAVCEGDDCWIDDRKLQLQYDYMMQHSNCSLCVHNTIKHDLKSGREYLFAEWKHTHILTAEDVFLKYCVHTSSYFIRRTCRDWPGNKYWFGDFVMLSWAFYKGDVVALPEIMSVYNCNNDNGVMMQISKSSLQVRMQKILAQQDYINEYNTITKYKFGDYSKRRSEQFEFQYLQTKYDDIILNSESKEECINAARKIKSHTYYRKYMKDLRGIQVLKTKYKYEGYRCYSLWKYVWARYYEK